MLFFLFCAPVNHRFAKGAKIATFFPATAKKAVVGCCSPSYRGFVLRL